MPKEGDIRVNPDTKQVETLTPEGVWSAQTMEQQMSALQKNASGLTQQITPQNINANEVSDASTIDTGTFPPVDNGASQVSLMGSTGVPITYQAEMTESERKEAEARAAQEALGEKPVADIAGTTAGAEGTYGVADLTQKKQDQAAKVAVLQGELDKVNVQEMKEIEAARAQLASVPTYIIERQVNQIQRNFASQKAYVAVELASQAALLSVYSGDLAEAKNQVKIAVDNYLYEITQKRQDFDTLYDRYEGWISSLDKEQKDILDKAREDVKAEEEKEYKEKTQIMEWRIKYAGSGIKITDTLDEAAAKAAEWQKAHPAGTTGEGKVLDILDYQRWSEQFPGAGILPTDTYEQARAKAGISVTPRNYSDDELKEIVNTAKSKLSYEQAIANMKLMPLILNQARAKEIIDEIYGKKKKAPLTPEQKATQQIKQQSTVTGWLSGKLGEVPKIWQQLSDAYKKAYNK